MTQGSNWDSHNHGPSEGRGMDCGEKPIGWCIRLAKDAEIDNLRAERDAAQEHVAYHLRDYTLNSESTGDLAVDMAAYAGRLRVRTEVAEAKVARVEALADELADTRPALADSIRAALKGA